MLENDEHIDDLAAGIAVAEQTADPRDRAFVGYARECGAAATLSASSSAVERPHSTPRPRELSFRHAKIVNRTGKHRASEPKRSRLGRAWLFGILLLTALLTIKFLPGGTTSRRGDATALASAEASGPIADRVAIEKVPIGHRSFGRNPLRDQVDLSLPDPDPATWRLVKLRMIKANGHPLDIELLRPLDYLDLIGATPGGTIDLDLAEMGACGPAEVLSIGPCPPIPPGRGAVITGRFVHELAPGDRLVDVHINGLPDPIGCTPNHLFWSETRHDFIPAADLQRGEKLLTATLGPVQVASIAPRPWERYVYNLEVHVEHVYQVGAAGTLVHNSYADRPPRKVSTPNAAARAKSQGQYIDPLTNSVVKSTDKLAADHIFPKARIMRLPGFKVLTPARQSQVLNNLENFRGLPQSLNASKGSRIDWSRYRGQPLDPQYAKELADLQEIMRMELQAQIDSLLGL